MRRIHPPSTDDGERPDECRKALEPAFMQFVERAEAVGWSREEIASATAALAEQATALDAHWHYG